jgi:hypothetical protein
VAAERTVPELLAPQAVRPNRSTAVALAAAIRPEVISVSPYPHVRLMRSCRQ